jgi:AcrR family transcriptional regulator
MRIRNERREAAIERMADHLLSEGLGGATLRPLAAAAGISDRMLLYYFEDKDEILTVTLHKIAARMITQLDDAVPVGRPRSFPVLLEEVWAALRSLSVKPFMHLWLDLASGAARGLQPHLKISGAIADEFLAWVTSRLEVQRGVDHPLTAALFVASIEGMHLLEAIGRRSIADSAVGELAARSKRRR